MRSLIVLAFAAAPLIAADFTVHEWGTFTVVVGSTGGMLPGLEVEEAGLPAFVGSFAGFAPANKGWNRPVSGVTVKMETPVLYFYSHQPRTVRVDVGFRGGSISQWYPARTGGEELPPIPKPWEFRVLPPIDFATGYNGSASWVVDVLARDTKEKISAPRGWETPHWPRARVADANRVRGPKGEVEGFIFYRGLGNFALPLDVRAARDGTLALHNRGADALPFVWVYEKPVGGAPVRSWTGALGAGGRTTVGPLKAGEVAFHAALTEAGLMAAEASALMATWRESYFERPGLRIFWILPRAFTDAVLPIKISPAPAKLERVLVGRTEVLTPQFEAELVHGFAVEGGKQWENDRYFRAYRERARQLGGMVGVAPVPERP